MRTYFEHLGVVVGAISGVLAARGKNMDLFGVTVLALVAAVGGGTVRDLVLGIKPVFWIGDSSFVLTGVVTAALMFFIASRWVIPLKSLDVIDAFVLALFTILGVFRALSVHSGDVNAVVMGVVTGVVGGIIRDVLVGEIPLVFRSETCLYATAATLGAVVYVSMEHFRPDQTANMVFGGLATLLLRLAAIRWNITLPPFDRSKTPEK